MTFEYTHRPNASEGLGVPEVEVQDLGLTVTDLEKMHLTNDDVDLQGYLELNGERKYLDVINLPLNAAAPNEPSDCGEYVRAEAARAFGNEAADSPLETKGYVLSICYENRSEAFFVQSVDRAQISTILASMRTAALESGLDAAVSCLEVACEVSSLSVVPV
jgi:hypothetical protein